MNLQVNLLEDHEVRSTSRVSKKFMIQGGTAAVVLGLLFYIAFLSIRQGSLTRSMASMQQEWADMEPRQKVVTVLMKDLDWHKKVKGELDTWQETAINWHEELAILANNVPPNMSFTAMEIKGGMQYLQKGSKVKRSRRYRISLVGVASGLDADETVLRFIQELHNTAGLNERLETAKLKRIQNVTSRRGTTDRGQRQFELEILFKEREWK